jgi:hypothetical protein
LEGSAPTPTPERYPNARRRGRGITCRVLGRPRIAPELEARIKKALASPNRPGVRELAKRFGVAVNTVRRISRPFEVNTA